MVKTRILLWHWGRRGGGPRYTYELAKAFQHHDDSLDLSLSLSRQCEIFNDFLSLGVPRFVVDTYSGMLTATLSLFRLPSVCKKFDWWLRDNRFDVVICTMSHLWNVPMLGAVRKSGARYVLVLHDAIPHPGENYLVRQWLLAREIEAADGIVTLTDSVRRTLVHRYGYPEHRTWVIPHGAFAYHLADEARTYPRGRPFKLMFFGRLLPYKGLRLLLDAYRVLISEGLTLSLMIAGPGDLSPYERAVRELQGITVDNRWIPEDEIGNFFKNADLVVLPYVEASQSGVIASAYASGLPVVATPVGGLAEQVSDGKTGLVTSDISVQALVSAIRRFVSDPVFYERCSAGALREADTNLSWSSVASRIADVIKRVRALPRRGNG